MNKALEKINHVLNRYKTCESGEEVIITQIEAITIKQALQVPSREDVCNALSELYGTKIFYEKTRFKDGFHNGNVFVVLYENNSIRLTTKYFNASLPPHLITMIGKFYESESETNE